VIPVIGLASFEARRRSSTARAGTGWWAGGNGNSTAWEYLEIEGPSDLGPHLESITSHTRLRSPTAAFEFKCVFMWSIDGSTWSAIMDLTTASGTAGQAISDPTGTWRRRETGSIHDSDRQPWRRDEVKGSSG